MKKAMAVLMILCLLSGACAATADMQIPAFSEMPKAVIEEGETVVDESAFYGEWVLNVAFADEKYVTEEELAGSYDYNFMPFMISEGKISQEVQKENGEFTPVEMQYTFEAGQLQGTDSAGRESVFELLEDGNIVMSVFFPGEGDTVTCLSVFLKRSPE